MRVPPDAFCPGALMNCEVPVQVPPLPLTVAVGYTNAGSLVVVVDPPPALIVRVRMVNPLVELLGLIVSVPRAVIVRVSELPAVTVHDVMQVAEPVPLLTVSEVVLKLFWMVKVSPTWPEIVEGESTESPL